MRRDISRISPLDVRSLSRLFTNKLATDGLRLSHKKDSATAEPFVRFNTKLFTKTKLLDKLTITLDICLLKVLKKSTSLTNHL